MKCTKCNSQIYNKDNICPNCGADMSITPNLINLAINKDEFATAELYRRTYDDVYRGIFVYIKNKDQIEDLVSETYIQGFKKLEQLNKPSSFPAWIITIGRNKAIDLTRKKKPKVSLDSFDELIENFDEKGLRLEEKLANDKVVIPIDEVDKRETHRLMEEILDSIPEEQSCVVKMFYYDEMSIREIAEILGCSENTVKSRLSYGRKKIQQEVLALEKKGTKLYGLAPISFFVFLLRVYNTIPVKPLSASVLASIESAVLGTTVTSTVASTAATVATTTSKGIALKVTTGIVAGIVAVSGGVIGGKKLYDNYKSDNATRPSTTITTQVPSTVATTTVPMTTVHMYKELSGSDTDYIKTLLAYTIYFPSTDYSEMSDSDMVDLLSMYYMVKENYEEGNDFFPSSKVVEQQGYKVKIAQKDFQNVAKNAFNKILPNTAKSDSVELKNGYYYFGVPASSKKYNINVKDVKYNKDKSKVTITYTFNGETTGEKTTEHTATFTRNGNNKDFPFRINSKKKIREIATNPTTSSTVETTTEPPKFTKEEMQKISNSSNFKYDGKVVDFGDYTLKVPNSWTYEKDPSYGILFCEPINRKNGGSAHIGWISKIKSSKTKNMFDGGLRRSFIAEKNGYTYYWGEPQSAETVLVDNNKELQNYWCDVYDSAACLEKSVLATFKLK